MKMSSDIIDVEVNVVSSPELSRSGSVDRQSLHSPQTTAQNASLNLSGSAAGNGNSSVGGSAGAVDTGDLKRSVAFASQINDNHSASQSHNSTSVNISMHPQSQSSYPTTPQHQLSNHPQHHHPHQQHHNHSSNSAESNNSSKTTMTPNSKKPSTTTTPSGYTSFSISSILSRNEPKKDVLFPSLPLLPLHHSPEDLHNSTMFSRWAKSKFVLLGEEYFCARAWWLFINLVPVCTLSDDSHFEWTMRTRKVSIFPSIMRHWSYWLIKWLSYILFCPHDNPPQEKIASHSIYQLHNKWTEWRTIREFFNYNSLFVFIWWMNLHSQE